MKKNLLCITLVGALISACSFGEYAQKDEDNPTSTIMKNGKKIYKFTSEGVENKTFFKVYKLDDEYKIVEYDFTKKMFEANMIKGGTSSTNGTYSITDDGYIKLVSDAVTYIKATKKDNDKFWLLWTTNKEDLDKNDATKYTYFFTSKEKAEDFVK